MSALIYDSATGAWQEPEEVPKAYSDKDGAYCDTVGYGHNGDEWEEVYGKAETEIPLMTSNTAPRGSVTYDSRIGSSLTDVAYTHFGGIYDSKFWCGWVDIENVDGIWYQYNFETYANVKNVSFYALAIYGNAMSVTVSLLIDGDFVDVGTVTISSSSYKRFVIDASKYVKKKVKAVRLSLSYKKYMYNVHFQCVNINKD